MVYSRSGVINLLKSQTFGFIFDDEAINSGYKRNFNLSAQQELIKIITAYRDNYNIHASAIPFFYSLDKDLRDLIFIHIHIIERGVAVLFLPLPDQIHSQDQWDTKNNIKIEEKENRLIQRNPNHKFRYHKLSTFAGYLYWKDLTKKQREIYKAIKKEKRSIAFLTDDELANQENLSFTDNLYNKMIEGKFTKDGLKEICKLQDKKYSVVCSTLNKMLVDNSEHKTLKYFLSETPRHKTKEEKELERKRKKAEYYKKNKGRWPKKQEE